MGRILRLLPPHLEFSAKALLRLSLALNGRFLKLRYSKPRPETTLVRLWRGLAKFSLPHDAPTLEKYRVAFLHCRGINISQKQYATL